MLLYDTESGFRFLQFGNLSAEYKEEMKFSSWNGFQKKGLESGDEQIVYITKNRAGLS